MVFLFPSGCTNKLGHLFIEQLRNSYIQAKVVTWKRVAFSYSVKISCIILDWLALEVKSQE